MTRQRRPSRRLATETGLAIVTGALAIVTALSPQWIERVFKVDPDQGSGALEWAIVGVLLVVSLVSALFARAEWHRSRMA